MKRYLTHSEKKQTLIDEVISKGIHEGDIVFVKNERKSVVKIEGDIVYVKNIDSYRDDKSVYAYNIKDCHVNVFDAGADPFPKNDWHRTVKNIAFDLESIIYHLFRNENTEREEYKINGHTVHETNFNPYVLNKDGKKEYFQRPLVWTIEDKQKLIESIYLGISCGQILVREHSWKEVENEFKKENYEICFFDVIDGKQRLNAVYDFMCGKFPDMHGNYYSDLSDHAQIRFGGSKCFTYAVMDTGTTDEDVISAFLGVNFAGVPQSMEHIEYVRSIFNNMNHVEN